MGDIHDESLMDAEDLAGILKKKKSSIYRSTRDGEFDSFVIRIGPKPVYRYSRRGLMAYISRGGSRVMPDGGASPRSEGVTA